MKNLTDQLNESENDSASFDVGVLTITYPGSKEHGDYVLTIGDVQPTHADIVGEFYEATTEENFLDIISFLEDVYLNGTDAINTTLSAAYKVKIFWLTAQEEINYPNGSGRRMPFSRFYEGVLAKLGHYNLERIKRKARVRDSRPPLETLPNGFNRPNFYRL